MPCPNHPCPILLNSAQKYLHLLLSTVVAVLMGLPGAGKTHFALSQEKPSETQSFPVNFDDLISRRRQAEMAQMAQLATKDKIEAPKEWRAT